MSPSSTPASPAPPCRLFVVVTIIMEGTRSPCVLTRPVRYVPLSLPKGGSSHNCDGPRSDAAQTSGSSVSTEVWTGVCSITGAIHFFQRRASVSDVGLGLFFPCLPGGIHLTSVRLLLFMKRRSSRLENLKNVDEFWLHSFLRDPFFSILFHSNKRKERFYGLAAHLMYFRCLWHPVISTPELRAALKNPQIKATLCYQYDEWNIRHLPIWLYYHPESVFFSGPCLWHGTRDGPSFWSRLKYVNNVKCFTDTHSLQRMNPNYFDDMLGFFLLRHHVVALLVVI